MIEGVECLVRFVCLSAHGLNCLRGMLEGTEHNVLHYCVNTTHHTEFVSKIKKNV